VLGKVLLAFWSVAVLFAHTRCLEAIPNLGDPCNREFLAVGFYARGDCYPTTSTFYLGHEFLTTIAFERAEEKFKAADDSPWPFSAEDDLQWLVEGNRRTDYPKGLLLHLSSGIGAYIKALYDYHNNPAYQHYHFLRDDRNTLTEAFQNGIGHISEVTQAARLDWRSERRAALIKFGHVLHTVEDSFCKAHTQRDPENNWAIVDIRAYVRRQPGAEPSAYHGGRAGDKRGHATPDDAIFLPTRECYLPDSREKKLNCLNPQAERSIEATTDLLFAIAVLLADEEFDQGQWDLMLARFFGDHFLFQPELR
jgi:hypothetical protein